VKDDIPHVWILESHSWVMADDKSKIAVFASREDAEAWLVLKTLRLGWGDEDVEPVFLPDCPRAFAWVHSLGKLTNPEPML
jgi:hypothetical protein